MESLRGHFLVASPHLPDPNFFRSVVLMVEHSAEGGLGLVLNRVSNVTIEQVWDELQSGECRSDQHLFVGGPVDGPLMALHSKSSLQSMQVLPGVFFSSEKSDLESIVATPPRHHRLFSGYSGWGPGQLEEELRAGGWLIHPAQAREVFGDPDEIWRRIVNAIGAEITDRAPQYSVRTGRPQLQLSRRGALDSRHHA